MDEMIKWYIIGMVLLALIVIGLYLFDKSKISQNKKYLVYGLLGLPAISIVFLMFLIELQEGIFSKNLLIISIFGFIFCIIGIYSGIKRGKKEE